MFQANHRTIRFLHDLQKQFQKPPFRLTSQHDDVSNTCCLHNTRKESLSHETKSLIRHMKNDLLSLDTFYEELTNTDHLFSSTGTVNIGTHLRQGDQKSSTSFSPLDDPGIETPIRKQITTRHIEEANLRLAKAPPPSFLLSLNQPRTLTLPDLYRDALDPNWLAIRGVWNPQKGYHLYDEKILAIRQKIKRRDIQIFDNKWVDITGEFPMFEAESISFYHRKFLKFWRPLTPYERRWEQVVQARAQAEEW